MNHNQYFQVISGALLYQWEIKPIPGLIFGLRPANERRHYFVTMSIISWAQPRISPEYHAGALNPSVEKTLTYMTSHMLDTNYN